MKYYLLLLLSVTIQFSFGQVFPDKEKDRVFNLNDNNNYLINLRVLDVSPALMKNVSGVEIVDARADTFALGYLKKGILRRFKKIRFETAGLTEIASLFNRMLIPDAASSRYEILFVIKELWLSEEDTDYDSKDKIHDTDKKMFAESYIKAKFDFYLKDGENYYALYRFDSTMMKTLPLKEYAGDHIQDVLRTSFNRLAQFDLSNISKMKTALTQPAIRDHYNDRFQLPILKDTTLRMGVYGSYDEFKSNSPAIGEYEIKKGKLGDELYVKSANGQWVVTRSVWGYCDGTTSFIKSGDNYFELVRAENSFYFYGSKGISRTEVVNYYYYGGMIARQNSGTKSYANILSPLKLNIETGKIY